MSTQKPPQLVSPAWQDREHVPALQTSPVAQGLSQPPQWLRSVERFRHTPPQLVRPAWQDREQLPLLHTLPAAHGLTHEPQ